MLNKPLTVTVSQLNRKISLMLSSEKTFSDLCIKGEISNFKLHDKSGHIFFSLKDDTSEIKAVMYNFNAVNLRFIPENGMAVVVRGAVKCYEKSGTYQLYASEIIPDGIGEQAIAFEQLKEKLKDEGLFSQKRSLPRFPEKICVITAETGAALQDILNILGRRYPICSVHIIPTLVQGEKSPDSIVNSFEIAQKTGSDLIIFGRGGGSAEDLSAFNAEKVVRAVYNSKIPTISAVGHETDVSLSDFAADLRAPTPSAAAELAVPDINELVSELDGLLSIIKHRTAERISICDSAVNLVFSTIKSNTPVHRLEKRSNIISETDKYIKERFNALILRKEQELAQKAAVIEALNPLSVLMRGYSIVYKDGKAVLSNRDLQSGDKIKVRLCNGEINAVVE